MRVVSLVPSVTETLLAWGIVPVAVTRFCEHPELPQVGGTKDPALAAIVDLGPDLVVMDDEENRRSDADALAAAGLRLHVTHVRSVGDVAPQLAALAAAVGVSCEPIEAPVVAVSERRAFVPIWRRPWMTMNGDTYGSSVLAVLGIVNVFAGLAGRYPEVTLEEVATCEPDLVLLPSEPYPFRERHADELRALVADVRLVDGQDLFWWGVRTPAALERLAQSLAASNPA
jgi:ABC-type Fe3+-hydroxamate transport system substrate-binding protein